MSRSATGPLTRSDWSAGMIQDQPRYLLPDNAVWDANECILNQDGKISKRGGTTNVMAAASAIVPQQISVMKSYSEDGLVTGLAIENPTSAQQIGNAGGGLFYTFTPGSGTSSITAVPILSVSTSSLYGIPITHGNTIVLACDAPSLTASFGGAFLTLWGGQASQANSFFTLAGSAVFTAGSRTVTGASAADILKITPGALIQGRNPTTGCVFRILTVNTGAQTYTVEPTPTVSMTFTTGSATVGTIIGFNQLCTAATAFPYTSGAKVGESHQNRLIIGDVTNVEGFGGVFGIYPARVSWSILPTEGTSRAGSTIQGLTYASSEGFEVYNYVDIPRLQKIVGLVSVNDNRLLVLGTAGTATIDGALPTNTAINTVLSGYQVNTVSTSVNCISQRSIQRAPKGVLFASRDGVYIYDGTQVHNVMENRIKQYWGNLVAGSGFAIYGSATLNPTTYVISGTSAGTPWTLICNLNGFRWSRSSSLSIMASAQDPSDLTRVYVCDAGATSASTTNKVYRLDTIMRPSVSNTTDHTGVAPSWSIQTKTDTGVAFSGRGRRLRVLEDPSILKRYKHATIVMNVTGSGSATVTMTPGLQGDESPQTVASFAPSATPTAQRVSFAPTVVSKAVGFTIAGSTAASTVDLISIQTDPSAMSMKRTS